MELKRSGMNTTSLLVVLAIVVVGAAAWYFISDPFRTKVDAAADQWTKWTPENIAKDPENYLNFCETETKSALEDLKASEIRIAQSKGTLENMRKEASGKVTVGEKALVELKEAYRKADASNTWPVKWQTLSGDKQWAQKQIVTFFKQTESQRKLAEKAEVGLSKLDAQQSKIQDARVQANDQLQEITTSRELLKVQKLTGDLQDRLVNMRTALQATASTASETENTVISLDQLQTESAPAVDNAEFEKIMGNGGAPAIPAGGV